MDKQTFYTQLSEKLSELGVSDDYIDRHLKQFDGYFEGKSEEEISREIEKLGSIDRVASRIKRMTDKIILAEQSENSSAQDSGSNEKEETADNSRIAEDSEKDNIKIPPEPDKIKAQSESIKDKTDNQAEETAKPSKPVQNPEPKVSVIEETPVPEEDFTVASPSRTRGVNKESKLDAERIRHAAPDEETIKKNTRKFWILFAVTLPITLAVILTIAFLFGILFFAIAVLIIAAVAILVAMTAGGTLVSVFGLIFGVAQMLSNLPIGLYECGISIIIGSSVLFCGILVYNFAVRLMPFAAKWLLIFAKYLVKKFRELYIYLKKECIGL